MPVRKLNFCAGFLFCLIFWQTPIFSQESAAKEKSAETSTAAEEKKEPKPRPENLIHFGDVIDVDVIGSVEYDWRGRMNPEGFLDGLEFVENPVYSLCRTEEQVARDIEKGYSKLLRNPQVVVKIVDKTGRPNSFLYGAVKKPQRFLLQRTVLLNEIIALGGGLTDNASGAIQIIRPARISCRFEENSSEQEVQSQKVSLSETSQTFNIKITDLLKGGRDANPKIENGDIITVEEAFPIYVIGGVMNPKQLNISTKMTVSRAVAAAGGLSKKADEENVTIYRRSGAETKIIKVSLKAIKADKAEDIFLQKYDVIEVEQSGEEKRTIAPAVRTEPDSSKKTLDMPLRIVSQDDNKLK